MVRAEMPNTRRTSARMSSLMRHASKSTLSTICGSRRAVADTRRPSPLSSLLIAASASDCRVERSLMASSGMNSSSKTTPRSRRMVIAVSHQPPVETSSRMEVALRVTPPYATPVILRCQSQNVIHDSETFTDWPVRALWSDSSHPVDAYDQQLPMDCRRTSVCPTSATGSTSSLRKSSEVSASPPHPAATVPAAIQAASHERRVRVIGSCMTMRSNAEMVEFAARLRHLLQSPNGHQ